MFKGLESGEVTEELTGNQRQPSCDQPLNHSQEPVTHNCRLRECLSEASTESNKRGSRGKTTSVNVVSPHRILDTET